MTAPAGPEGEGGQLTQPGASVSAGRPRFWFPFIAFMAWAVSGWPPIAHGPPSVSRTRTLVTPRMDSPATDTTASVAVDLRAMTAVWMGLDNVPAALAHRRMEEARRSRDMSESRVYGPDVMTVSDRDKGPASAEAPTYFPDHWREVGWEQKARENPLSAVMTIQEMEAAPAEDFSPEMLEAFFTKGRLLFNNHIAPRLTELLATDAKPLVVEYGCGAGRILRAVVDAGYPCAGIDISRTMLRHCARLVPEPALYPLDDAGRCALPSDSAALVYSYAVVQHISRLSNYVTAIDEMCRVVQPGGVLAAQVNCEDFAHGDLDNPDRTENFETYSLHYRAGESEPHQRHKYNEWSGVYIGYGTLQGLLAERGLTIERRYFHTRKKLRGLWIVARKAA